MDNMDIWQSKQAKEIAERLQLKDLKESMFFPKYFQMETVFACNSRCMMCAIEWEQGRSAFVSEAIFGKFVEEISTYSDWVESVCLQGAGEPTLDKALPERIKKLKDAGVKKTSFSTNGQLLNADFAEECIVNGLDDLMLSIDAATEKTYKIVRPHLDFHTVRENAQNVIRLRDAINPNMIIRVRMVVLEENKHEIQEWTEFWKSRLKKHDRVDAMQAHTFGNQLRIEAEEDVSRYADKVCSSLFSTCYIYTDGSVALCCADCNKKYAMGDLVKNSIKEIWNNDKFTQFRDYHLNKKRNEIEMCRGCHIW